MAIMAEHSYGRPVDGIEQSNGRRGIVAEVTTTPTRAIAFLVPQHAAQRTKDIRRYARSKRLSVSFDTTDPITALSEAIMQRRQGAPVVLVGHLNDVSSLTVITANQAQSDAPAIRTEHLANREREVREAFRALAAEHGIELHALDMAEYVDEPSKSDRQVMATIGAYTEAMAAMTAIAGAYRAQRMRRARKPRAYINGRPPYGYTVRAGKLEVNPYQADAVRVIFKERENTRSGELLELLKKRFPVIEKGSRKAQSWTRCKLQRILSHADLYRQGRLSNPSLGVEITLPELVILSS